MSAISYVSLAGFLVLAILQSVAQAQPRNQLNWWVSPQLPRIPSASGQVVFPKDAAFDFELWVMNDEESSRPIVLDENFVKPTQLTILDASGRVLAANSGWHPEGSCAGVPKCPLGTRIVLKPSDSAVFRGTFITSDMERLPDGEYRIQGTVSDALKHVLNEDLSPWQGNGLTTGTRPLSVGTPRTERELIAVDLYEATRASLENDHEGALRIYQRILATRPNDTLVALRGIAQSQLALRRFAEAATTLERAVTLEGVKSGEPRISSATLLAIAYFALGQDAKAEAVVRAHYDPKAFADVIKTARTAAARMKSGR